MKTEIVVIGGGTGSYTVLEGLKRYTVQLTVVSVADDGGKLNGFGMSSATSPQVICENA